MDLYIDSSADSVTIINSESAMDIAGDTSKIAACSANPCTFTSGGTLCIDNNSPSIGVSCSIPPNCITPTITTGYHNASKVENVLTPSNVMANGWTCAVGFVGTASVVPCSSFGEPYTLSGCIMCTTGKYNDQEDQQLECKNCATGKHNMENQKTNESDCVLCEVGRYNDVEGLGETCYRCPKAKTQGESSCDACLPGKHKQQDSVNCIDCSAGQYTDDIDISICFKCPIGYHAKNFSTIQDDNRKRNDGCTGCPRGKHGTTEEAVNETTGCKVCIAGRFTDLEAVSTTYTLDNIFCKPCAVGRWNDQVKSTKESDCQNCNAGRYSTTVASSLISNCKKCSKGTFLDIVGADEETDCRNCPAGFAQEQGGAAYCLPCTPGKHQHLEGKSTCTECQIGRSASIVGNNQTECTTCPAGYTSSKRGSVSCLPCIPGTYQNETGKSRCISCAANTKSPSANSTHCISCDLGKVATAGSVRSRICWDSVERCV